MSTIPITSQKEKQKNKPKIGAGSKDEKRKQKKEKLAEVLQMKKDAQEAAQKPPEPPVTLGKEFFDCLDQISATEVPDTSRKLNKRQQTLNAVMQMKQIFATTSFANTNNVLNVVDQQINMKTEILQTKLAQEEQKRLEQEKQAKLKQKQEQKH
ncbi:TolA [Tritrichomonas foetus]|uniref:TolA n=1 Tax=Tritrichomonas foetus TaxID=1144522 RepID=A0A1J4K4U7_9EUKA|nr:TolA [Tritrichomonas foetus]|eukprot:OHT06415.1 TolA [Tritrichomonas foetus]